MLINRTIKTTTELNIVEEMNFPLYRKTGNDFIMISETGYVKVTVIQYNNNPFNENISNAWISSNRFANADKDISDLLNKFLIHVDQEEFFEQYQTASIIIESAVLPEPLSSLQNLNDYE